MDGVDIRELTLENLRQQISFVTQDVVLFDDTIRHNLIYGLKDVSDEAIEEAVKHAALTDFIASLPNGLDTKVGEGGGLLSGGQKQRLSIARAFLKNAPILILDEATSALDSKTEKAITESLEKLCQNRTCLTVAHRFSTIENVDTIAVLVQGKLVEHGTHQALIEKDGVYARLSRLQAQPAIAP